MNKKRKFDKICRDIKSVKIQGARNIAREALKAYHLIPTPVSKKILLSLRPTEPMLINVLNRLDKESYNKILSHFEEAQDKINKKVLKLINQNDIILTHCHSTNVINSLIYAKKKGKHFEVYNTETRPLYQGRKTAKQLKNAGIKVTIIPDSAVGIVLAGEQGMKKAKKVFLGSDALLKTGIINKIGSEVIAELAKKEKTPVYVIADSWKFTKTKIPLEQRNLNEVWNNAPKNIKIINPAFEFVKKKYITKIITDE